MKPIDIQNADHYTWGTDCDSWLLCEQESLSVKQERMPPGTREQRHYHSRATQFFYILDGNARFYIGNAVIELKARQGIAILPGSQHFISNETSAWLEFLVISQPSTKMDRINLT